MAVAHVTIRDANMSYHEYGSGYPLVFVHSFLWDSHVWDRQITYFSKRYRCIALDLWGHGESDTRTEREIPIEVITQDVWAFLQTLGIESCIFAGLSLGGMIGMRLAHQHPEFFKGMLIFDSYLGAESEEKKQEYFPMIAAVEESEFFAPEFVQMIARYFFSATTYTTQPDLVTDFERRLASIPFLRVPTVTAVGRGVYGRPSFLEELKEIKVPTLYLSGEDDVPRPMHESKEMAAITPGASYISIPDGGYVACLEQGAFVNKQIEPFIERVLGVRGQGKDVA
ncbi:MAG: hypothetical protein C0514_00845 [Candidatus Puniceispirillum sp.]|nr:hypothetical protein [Candidatus Puniceispirillum sp.]